MKLNKFLLYTPILGLLYVILLIIKHEKITITNVSQHRMFVIIIMHIFLILSLSLSTIFLALR